MNPDYTPADTGYIDEEGRHVTADGKPDRRYEENRVMSEPEALRLQARNLETIAKKAKEEEDIRNKEKAEPSGTKKKLSFWGS